MKATRLIAIGILSVLIAASSVLAYVTFGSGTLMVKMKDPPARWGPAEEVYITFSNIEIHRADAGNESGWFNTGVSAVNFSLSDVVNVSRVIGQTSLQAGLYNIIRFNITKAIVTVNGVNYTCTVESGMLNVAITQGGVRVNAGQDSYIEIDIDVIVTGREGDFKLTPAARATSV